MVAVLLEVGATSALAAKNKVRLPMHLPVRLAIQHAAPLVYLRCTTYRALTTAAEESSTDAQFRQSALDLAKKHNQTAVVQQMKRFQATTGR